MARDIGDLLSHIRGLRGAAYGVGASSEEVRQAEMALGVNFPWSFSRYLEAVGWLSLGPHEVFGLGCDVPRHLRLVEIASSERREFHPPIPESLVPFYNDGGGNHYCIDLSASREGESPVVFWDHELPPGQVPNRVADSFGDWLESICDGFGRL